MQSRGFSIGQVFGIDIRLDPSLLIIFALIVISLAIGVFPAWHPDWSAWTSWGIAAAAGILFLVSVLLHELAHSLVAKAYGLPVRTITLYLFGGFANVEEEPKRPGIEFLMAVVGPLTSIALGVLFLVAGGLLAGPPDGVPPEQFAQQLGPVATLLAWLGPVNLMLGVFNLLPGFPLDGGRMLRAGLWKVTGDFVKATRWSARSGTLIGWMLVAIGVAMALGMWIPGLGTGLVGGIWLALIGWFLSRLAGWGYQRTVLESALENVHVSDVMARHLRSIPPDLTVGEFTREHASQYDQTSWPVMLGDRMLGVVRTDDLRRVDRNRWDETPVSAIMVPADQLPVTSPGDTATEALRKLSQSRSAHVAVQERGHLLGFVRQPDIVRWLQLHGDDLATP